MSGKEDLRVRRTKKALFDAFKVLLNQSTIDDITINELCDAAGIRRATFYKHYSDKFDFLTAYTGFLRDNFDHVMRKAGKPTLTTDYYVSYAKRIVGFITENEVAIDNIFKSNLFPVVMSTIVEQNYKDTCERLRASVASGSMKLNASVEVTASMCAGGVARTIYQWFRDGKKIDADELADQIAIVVAAAIEQNK